MTEICDADNAAIAFLVMLKDTDRPGNPPLRLAFCRHHFNRYHRKLIEEGWYPWTAHTESRQLEVTPYILRVRSVGNERGCAWGD